MRSFLGRDILSLKDFERNEFEHVFGVADELRPIAERRQNTDLLEDKTLLTAFYQPSTRTRLARYSMMFGWGRCSPRYALGRSVKASDFGPFITRMSR